MGKFGEEFRKAQEETLAVLGKKCVEFADKHRVIEKIAEVVNGSKTSGRKTIHRLFRYNPFGLDGAEYFGFYKETEDCKRYEIGRRLVVGTLKDDSTAKWLSEDFDMFRNALIPIAEEFGSIDRLFSADIWQYVDYKSWQNPEQMPYTTESKIEGLRVPNDAARSVMFRLNNDK